MDEVTVQELDEEYDWWAENCSVIEPETLRLVIVGVLGCLIACVSVVFNVFLFIVLLRGRRGRHSHLVYLTLLALFDVFLSAAYIMLFPVNLYMDYFDSELLARTWFSYMPYMMCCSHVAISASAFLIVAAAFERYVSIAKVRARVVQASRGWISTGAVLFALIAKGPLMYELEVVENGNCTGVTAFTAQVAEFSETEPYKTVYKFWFRNILTIFLPFALCFYLNFQIIRQLRYQYAGAKLFRFATSEHRENIRSATLMLVTVTCSYLASNVVNVIVNAWEFIDKKSLLTEQFRPIYTYSSDLVSLLTVMASACRLPIYYACNNRIRRELQLHFRSLFGIDGGNKKTRDMTMYGRATTIRYCQTGTGFLVYETSSRHGSPRARCIGTGLDKVVLSVAMAAGRTKGDNTLHPHSFTNAI